MSQTSYYPEVDPKLWMGQAKYCDHAQDQIIPPQVLESV